MPNDVMMLELVLLDFGMYFLCSVQIAFRGQTGVLNSHGLYYGLPETCMQPLSTMVRPVAHAIMHILMRSVGSIAHSVCGELFFLVITKHDDHQCDEHRP